MPVLHYTISETDYVAASRLYRQRVGTWGRVMRYALVLAGLVFAVIGLLIHTWWLAIVGVVYALAPWWVPRALHEPLLRRSYRKYPAMHGEQTMQIAEDGSGVIASSVAGHSNLTWPLITQWAQNEQYLLLFLQPRMYFIVPTRADLRNEVLPPLRQMLLDHVGPAKK